MLRKFEKMHRGILIDQIPVNGIAGLIFAVGVVVIFLIGIPPLRIFGLIALPVAAVVAAVLYWWHNQTRW